MRKEFEKEYTCIIPFHILCIIPFPGMATHSSILSWRIPWTEEPGGLQSTDRKESDMTEKLTLSPLNHFAVHLKLIHCISTILQYKI